MQNILLQEENLEYSLKQMQSGLLQGANLEHFLIAGTFSKANAKHSATGNKLRIFSQENAKQPALESQL